MVDPFRRREAVGELEHEGPGGHAAKAGPATIDGMEPVLVALMVILLLLGGVVALYLLRKAVDSQQDR